MQPQTQSVGRIRPVGTAIALAVAAGSAFLALSAQPFEKLSPELEAASRIMPQEITTQWLGMVVIAEEKASQPYPPFQHVTDADGNRVTETGPQLNMLIDEKIEIGLRSDGVVVWRKKQVPNT